MAQARGFFERALALEPGNVEALVGTASVNFAIGSQLFDRRSDRTSHRSRGGGHKGAVLGTEPSLGSLRPGPGANFYEPRGSRHRRMRAGIGAGSEFGPRRTGNIGIAKFFLGRGAETEAHVEQALRLSPRDISRLYLEFVCRSRQTLAAAPTPKRLFGCAGALRPTEMTPVRISISRLPWRASVSWMRHGLQCRRALRSIRVSLSAAFRTNTPSNHPVYLAGRERVYEGLRMAGVPER